MPASLDVASGPAVHSSVFANFVFLNLFVGNLNAMRDQRDLDTFK